MAGRSPKARWQRQVWLPAGARRKIKNARRYVSLTARVASMLQARSQCTISQWVFPGDCRPYLVTSRNRRAASALAPAYDAHEARRGRSRRLHHHANCGPQQRHRLTAVRSPFARVSGACFRTPGDSECEGYGCQAARGAEALAPHYSFHYSGESNACKSLKGP